MELRKKEDKLGFDGVHLSIKKAPYCNKKERITKVIVCPKCYIKEKKLSKKAGYCYLCYKEGIKHYVFNDYPDESFDVDFFCCRCEKEMIFEMMFNDLKSEFYYCHSRPQRPRSFWSAPRIETSGPSQHRKSANHGLIVKYDNSDWLKTIGRLFCACSLIGTGQRSRFLVLTKRIAASGDENVLLFEIIRN